MVEVTSTVGHLRVHEPHSLIMTQDEGPTAGLPWDKPHIGHRWIPLDLVFFFFLFLKGIVPGQLGWACGVPRGLMLNTTI